MKKIFFPLLAFLALSIFFICACGEKSPEIVQTEEVQIVTTGKTPKGTPIIDEEESEFSLSDADIFSTPDSSCFSRIGYSEEYEILVVTFRDSGATYLYLDFPYDEWDDFQNADSLGGYYNEYIKGCYECNKY